ncbi:MAG: HlyD family efflux transporter periplasmic adaptor subunit, partial [Akkermansiaceae bacterium]|nr:HlyD family efflux transporter periplasmic adaptor subunit [Akkermansiaceae bacterium]
MNDILKNGKELAVSVLRENRLWLAALAVAAGLLVALGWFVLRPAYLDTNSRFYTSKLGYPSLLRKAGKPLPVGAASAQVREFRHAVMGEGTCASEPILVPAIPMARVIRVTVNAGEVVEEGQVLAELDTTRARIKRESAKLAVSTAQAELERVRAGSAYVLAQERPEVETINLAAEEERAALAREKVERFRSAERRGVVSRAKLLEIETEFTEAERSLAQTRLAKRMAEAGVAQSLLIAENAVRDAQEALEHREAELEDYVVRAPAAGVIERVLIHEGEYNQDSGKPAFIIASGLWFEACFDQSDFALVREGQEAEVRLAAYAGEVFAGTVRRIVPVVSFNQGGPEISRPLRPRGTGSPEWAATFKVRVEFDALPST